MVSISNGDSIFKDLDELAVRILDLMNQYIACKMNLENHIRSGCLDLAKARYLTSNRNISSLQLPSEDAIGVTAKFRVLSSTSNQDDVKIFESVRNEVEILTQGMEKVSLANDDSSIKTKRLKQISNDPLKWFGILVPQDLRNSQKMFEKCLEIAIESSNIQSQLIHCMNRYESCKRKVSRDS